MNACIHPSIAHPWKGRCRSWLRRAGNAIAAVLLANTLIAAPIPVQANNSRQPDRPCYGVYHTVRGGQTIYSIAGAYRTSAYRILLCNGLNAYSVYSGQTLLIPIYRSR